MKRSASPIAAVGRLSGVSEPCCSGVRTGANPSTTSSGVPDDVYHAGIDGVVEERPVGHSTLLGIQAEGFIEGMLRDECIRPRLGVMPIARPFVESRFCYESSTNWIELDVAAARQEVPIR